MKGSSTHSASYGASAASPTKPAKLTANSGLDAAAAHPAPVVWHLGRGGFSRSDDQYNDGFDGWWGATLCASPSLLGPEIMGMGQKQQSQEAAAAAAEEIARAPRRLHPSERKVTCAPVGTMSLESTARTGKVEGAHIGTTSIDDVMTLDLDLGWSPPVTTAT